MPEQSKIYKYLSLISNLIFFIYLQVYAIYIFSQSFQKHIYDQRLSFLYSEALSTSISYNDAISLDFRSSRVILYNLQPIISSQSIFHFSS